MKYVVAEEMLVVEGSETAPEEQKRNLFGAFIAERRRVLTQHCAEWSIVQSRHTYGVLEFS